MVRIGVDPAFRKGGFYIAIYDSSDRSMRFKGFKSVLDYYDWIRSDEAPEKATCIIEDSNLQNHTFDKKGNRGVIMAKSRSVGKNQAISDTAVEASEKRYGKDNVYAISPKQKGAKWTKRQFESVMIMKKITLDKRQSNQDQRDAAKLALFPISTLKFKTK